MKRYVYYQPNDKDLKDKTGDCQVRALSKALNISWLEAFDLTIPICRELQTYTIFDGNFEKTKEAMKQLGFDYHGIPVQKGKKRPTVLSFAKEHSTGTYICRIAHHAVAVVDGRYFDTWDSGQCKLYGYYERI